MKHIKLFENFDSDTRYNLECIIGSYGKTADEIKDEDIDNIIELFKERYGNSISDEQLISHINNTIKYIISMSWK